MQFLSPSVVLVAFVVLVVIVGPNIVVVMVDKVVVCRNVEGNVENVDESIDEVDKIDEVSGTSVLELCEDIMIVVVSLLVVFSLVVIVDVSIVTVFVTSDETSVEVPEDILDVSDIIIVLVVSSIDVSVDKIIPVVRNDVTFDVSVVSIVDVVEGVVDCVVLDLFLGHSGVVDRTSDVVEISEYVDDNVADVVLVSSIVVVVLLSIGVVLVERLVVIGDVATVLVIDEVSSSTMLVDESIDEVIFVEVVVYSEVLKVVSFVSFLMHTYRSSYLNLPSSLGLAVHATVETHIFYRHLINLYITNFVCKVYQIRYFLYFIREKIK